MRATVKIITDYIEELAPLSAALPGDPVGLQLGNPAAEVRKVLVALDPDQAAVEEAIAGSADLLVTHHPLFYNNLASINEEDPAGALIAAAIRSRLNIYSAHTNFDVVSQGVTCQLVKTLGFVFKESEIIEITGSDQLLKLVAFVPAGHEDAIRTALAEAGAGYIGNYSHCTFQTKGTGTFMPGAETAPYLGSPGRLEKVDELRLETILPTGRRAAVLAALKKAHPYEEVAYDLYPLDLEGKPVGLGLIIELFEPLSPEQILALCREKLGVRNLRCWTAGKNSFKRIALCGGSGGSLIENAAALKADLFISGDFRYHDLKQAEALGLALLDAGHDATEKPGVAYLQQYLKRKMKDDFFRTEVCLQTSVGAKWS